MYVSQQYLGYVTKKRSDIYLVSRKRAQERKKKERKKERKKRSKKCYIPKPCSRRNVAMVSRFWPTPTMCTVSSKRAQESRYTRSCRA